MRLRKLKNIYYEQNTGNRFRNTADGSSGLTEPKNTGNTGNKGDITLEQASKNISNKINDVNEEAEDASKNAPKIDDINTGSSTMDINADEHHPRNFISTVNQMADEVDFETGVEGSNAKATSKAQREARKAILDDVKEQHKDSYDKLNADREKWAENQSTLKASNEKEKKIKENNSNLKKENKAAYKGAIKAIKAEAREEYNAKKAELDKKNLSEEEYNEELNKLDDEYLKTTNEKIKPIKDKYKEDKKTLKDDLSRELMYSKIEREADKNSIKSPNAAQIGLEGLKSSVAFVSRNEGLIKEIDRISQLPEGEEKENAIKALEEKYGTTTGEAKEPKTVMQIEQEVDNMPVGSERDKLLESVGIDAKQYRLAELRANQGITWDEWNDAKRPSSGPLFEAKEAAKKASTEAGADKAFQNDVAAKEYLANAWNTAHKPETVAETVNPIRGMVDRYTKSYQTAFDEAKEKSRLDRIKRRKGLYKGYLIWTNLMSKIQEAAHNFANPNNRITADDAISQRQGQDIAKMIENRNKKNENYINEQIEYLKNVLGKDIETAGFAQEMKNGRLKSAYAKMNEEQKKLLGALIVADTNHTIAPTYKLQLADQMLDGKITTVPQLLSALAGLGTKTGVTYEEVIKSFMNFFNLGGK